MADYAIPNGVKIEDRYVIDSRIGEGGGGIVYKAFDVNLQMYVVIKQIKDNASSLLESRTEVDILKQLKHERLPKVMNFFEFEGRIYTVMDFISGINLAQALKYQGRYPQKTVLRWAVQLADALSYLHSQKPAVIHSDIKPANVMMDPSSGDITLIDFNISLAFSKNQLNSTWVSGGYSPPEQYKNLEEYFTYLENTHKQSTKFYSRPGSRASGNTETEMMYRDTGDMRTASTRIFNRNTVPIVEQTVGRGVDARSDVYSFGATLYHLLTGIRPDMDFQYIVPISNYDIDLSEGFCHIIEKCMDLNPERRYQNGIELRDAFRNIIRLDREYISYKQKSRVRKIVCASLIAAGILISFAGYQMYLGEKGTEYSRMIQQADTLAGSGDISSATDLLTKARDLKPSALDAYEHLAEAYYKAGQYDEAIKSAADTLGNQTIKVTAADNETLGNLYFVMGDSYMENEAYADGSQAFQKAIDKFQKNNLYYRDYAICLARGGDPDAAQKILDQAISSNLDTDSVTYAEAEIAYARQDYQTAQQKFKSVLSSTKDDELRQRSILMTAETYSKFEDLEGEISFLSQYANEDSTSLQMRIDKMIGDAWIKEGNKDTSRLADCDGKALEQYEKLYANGYTSAGNLEKIAILEQNLQQYDKAEATLKEMTDKYPEDYRGYKRLGFLYAAMEQTKAEANRDYTDFKNACDKAFELYSAAGSSSDPDMQELQSTYDNAKKGGWFS